MVPSSVGAVILIPFPFSDLSKSKLRPAVVLANCERGEFLLCQVTSKPYADARAVEIAEVDFETGGLRVVSYARPLKLFTAHSSLIAREVGRLSPDALRRIRAPLISALR